MDDEYSKKIEAILRWAEEHKNDFEYHHYVIIPFNPQYVESLKDKLLTTKEENMIDQIIHKLNITI